ncbi:MAG: AMP-binding protein, partial [Desulfovibrio sp.]|nr:AMP-binding protein [Desulfovibrio sp.]
MQTTVQDMNAFPAFPEFDAVDRYVVDALLMRTASLWPDEEGLVHVKSGFRQSWRGLAEDVDKLARGLCALGFRKGDRIALWGVTLPHWVTWFFAIERLGLVAVPINSGCHPEELADFLVRSRSKAICLVDGPREEEFIEGTRRVVPGLESGPERVVRLQQFPDLRHVLFSGMEPREGMHCFAELEELGRTVDED